jgi:hypothetical protein
MSQDEAFQAKKLLGDHGFTARVRKGPGGRDPYIVLVSREDGFAARLDRWHDAERLIKRQGR